MATLCRGRSDQKIQNQKTPSLSGDTLPSSGPCSTSTQSSPLSPHLDLGPRPCNAAKMFPLAFADLVPQTFVLFFCGWSSPFMKPCISTVGSRIINAMMNLLFCPPTHRGLGGEALASASMSKQWLPSHAPPPAHRTLNDAVPSHTRLIN